MSWLPFTVAGVAAIALLAPGSITVMPRGMRVNNPGNIRISAYNDWLGKVTPSKDSAFETFTHPAYGIRAIGKLIDSYKRQGHHTIDEIIHKFAPPVENETLHYIEFVEKVTGRTRNFTPLRNSGDYTKLVSAIIQMESGKQYFDDAYIKTALELA